LLFLIFLTHFSILTLLIGHFLAFILFHIMQFLIFFQDPSHHIVE